MRARPGGVRDGARREGGVVALEDVARGVRGGCDDRGDRPEAQRHERAVARRESREGAVWVGAEVEEVADERQWARAWGKVAAAAGEEEAEVQGRDDEDGT